MKRNPSHLTSKSKIIINNKKCVIITGGGSGGHLFPLQSVSRELKKKGVAQVYLGRDDSLEREILGDIDRFYPIAVGKLRRNWSIKVFLLNFIDLFKIIGGLSKSFIIITRIKKQYPNVVIFSTGGFAAIPTILAGYFRGVPIVIHEQTARAGLANRISGILADVICTSFPESGPLFNPKKTIYTGFPLRESFYKKNPKNIKNLELKKILAGKNPLILISGGSNGSKLINEWVKEFLPKLVKQYTVCHQTGKGFYEEFSKIKMAGKSRGRTYHPYYPIGFISQEGWGMLLDKADVVVGRSGAGIVHECIHLKKKAVFIPLAIAQKNEQYYNAVAAQNFIDVSIIPESEIASTDLIYLLETKLKKKNPLRKKNFKPANLATAVKDKPVNKIVKIILSRL